MLNPEYIYELDEQRRKAILNRSKVDVSSVYKSTLEILNDIRERGDAVTLEHYRKYKQSLTHEDLEVKREEIDAAYCSIKPGIVKELKFAATNIEKFHRAQMEREMWSTEILEGVIAGRLVRPMDRVGCYVPGRQAIYPSSVLMTIIPAKVAGIKNVIACTPPDTGMVANDATLVAADIAGADYIYKVGGPWAVGSMAYGTSAISKVDKIVGPGNKYVTAAKLLVFGEVDIDSPAGPSESLILTDDSADPYWLTIDLLSQVEHDEDAAGVLVTTSHKIAEEVCGYVKTLLTDDVPRKEIMLPAIQRHSAVLIARDLNEAIEFTNEYAAEHLQIVTEDPFALLPRINHAGSIFLGPFAPVPVGDYASGTNHVLPTGGCARMFNGLSVDDFVKHPTFQYLTRNGLKNLRTCVTTLARAEGLFMHARAVDVRFERDAPSPSD